MRKTAVATAIGLALTMAGCGGDDGGTSTSSLSITDAPLDGVTAVWLQFTGVELKPDSGPPETILFDAPKGYDLLTLQNGNAALLLDDTTMPAGNYQWLRLILDPAPGSAYVMDADGRHDLIIPSGAQTGLKLVRGFVMPAGGRADFTIDFKLHESIIAPPGLSPNYLMKPVLRMTNNVETGTITGRFLTPTFAPICGGDAPTMYLFEGAGVTPDDVYNPLEGAPDTAPDVNPLVTTSAAVMNNALEYRFSFVEAGTYTVAFTCDADDPGVDEDTTSPLEFFSFPDPVIVVAGETTTADF